MTLELSECNICLRERRGGFGLIGYGISIDFVGDEIRSFVSLDLSENEMAAQPEILRGLENGRVTFCEGNQCYCLTLSDKDRHALADGIVSFLKEKS